MKSAILLAVPVMAAMAGEFQFDGKTFAVPEGFTVERVAGPPLVDRPIEADFDSQGRLYVTDSSGTNDKSEKQLQDKPHRIVRLTDKNGDGIFDERAIFADKMMFPEGALFFEGSLYVSAPPVIWKLTDTDNDGVADKREEWFNGGTLTGCANDLHGPYAGPDGRIYWTKGAFAKQTHERDGREPIVTRAAHIFRARPDGKDLEVVMTGGMDNPVGVAFTREGERFFTSTFLLNPEAGRRDGMVHAIYGGVYGKDHDVVNEHPRTGELMPITTHLGPAAPAGLHRYDSGVFGPDFDGNMFVAQFNLRKVSRHVLRREGATFKTIDSDFMSSDNTDFHPTDVFEDKDGSLIVIDTGGWYKLCCPTSQLAKPDVLGAIYRIRKIGAKPDPRAPDKIDAVWSAVRASKAEPVRQALTDSDASVRIAAIHGIGLMRDKQAVPALLRSLEKGGAHEKRAAAEALGRVGDASVVAPILKAAATDLDRVLEHSLAFALIEIANPAATRAGLTATHLNTRRVALIALTQMKDGLTPSDVAPLLANAEPELRQTAAWIAQRKPEWAGQFASEAEKRFAAEGMTDSEREIWTALLARLASAREMQKFLIKLAGDTNSSNRLTAFKAMRQARLKTVPEGWTMAIAKQTRTKDPNALRAAIDAARDLPPKTAAPEILGSLTRIAEDGSLDASLRVAALRALPEGMIVADSTFRLLADSLSPSTPPAVRADAVGALHRVKLTPREYELLASCAHEVGPMELPRLLDLLEKDPREEVGIKLVDSLKKSRAAQSLPAEMLRQKFAKFPENVRAAAAAISPAQTEEAAALRANLQSRLERLKGGDTRRGQALFNSTKTACVSCHAIGYVGGKVGPDLTTIGTVRTEIDLLEAIIYPSASFVRSYEPAVAITKDGETHSGILRGDNDEAITLVAGPNLQERIARADIAELRPGALSIMPAGLDTQLNDQELADLIAFLKGTKWGAN